MKNKMFRPLAFAQKLLDEAGADELTDERLREIAKDGASKIDAMFPIPGKLGALVDATNLDRVLFETILYVVLHEIRDDIDEGV